MEIIKVLIVDDSVVFRSQIRAALEGLEGIKVVGAVSNGKIALERLEQNKIDLLMLDLEMPEMNGIETLKEMKKRSLMLKVIVFSSFSKSGADSTLEALRFGASDFITKPTGEELSLNSDMQPFEKIRALVSPKISALFSGPNTDFNSSNNQPVSETQRRVRPVTDSFPTVLWELFKPKLIVIGCSTGGPTALEKIFSRIRGPLGCPILIVQHMPPLFTETLAARLGKLSNIHAAEAKHLEPLEKNRIYMAPGNYHMRLIFSEQQGMRISLDQEPLVHFVRPAVDLLFTSAANLFKDKCLGIILTGMGEDGKVGAKAVKSAGGAVMIQNKESCVVFGMPGAVFSSGAYDRIGDLEEITQTINNVANE